MRLLRRSREPMTSFHRFSLSLVGLLSVASCAPLTDPDDGPARRGVVSAASPEAADAGAEILARGGNAIDAAVAVSMALAVTEPAGSGLGGQVYMLVHPKDGAPFVIEGSTRSPAATPTDARRSDLVGYRATTVPSHVRVLDHAWRQYGSGKVDWAELLAPAIRHARDGFPSGSFRTNSLERYRTAMQAHPETAKIFLEPDGSVPDPSARLVQAALARTLERLATAGADDFYRGEIARAIDRDMREHGGWLTYDDLASFDEPSITTPLVGTHRGYDVYTLPPPTGGWVVLQALNVLEQAPGELLAGHDDEAAIWMAEALRAVHGNRKERPVQDLESYEDGVRRRTSKARAEELVREFELGGSGETTHFSVVDAEGNAVACTQSLNAYFGAKVLSPELGVLYNDYMREFVTDDADHPFALRPDGLPYSSMSATILAKDGRPVLALGSPGSRRIISAVIQVANHWVTQREGVRAAVAAPRLHVLPEDDTLMIELRPTSRTLLLELERRGFHPSIPLSSLFEGRLNAYFGGVHAVALDGDRWAGAADPRRDGAVRIVPAP